MYAIKFWFTIGIANICQFSGFLHEKNWKKIIFFWKLSFDLRWSTTVFLEKKDKKRSRIKAYPGPCGNYYMGPVGTAKFYLLFLADPLTPGSSPELNILFFKKLKKNYFLKLIYILNNFDPWMVKLQLFDYNIAQGFQLDDSYSLRITKF